METRQKETCLRPLSLKVHGGKADESSPVSESLVREHGRGIWRLELGLKGILKAG